jgi:hypothetical protein
MRRVCDAKLTQDLLQTYTSLQRRTALSGCAQQAKWPLARLCRAGRAIAMQRGCQGARIWPDRSEVFSVRNRQKNLKRTQGRCSGKAAAETWGIKAGRQELRHGGPAVRRGSEAAAPERSVRSGQGVAGAGWAVGVGRLSPSSSALTRARPGPGRRSCRCRYASAPPRYGRRWPGPRTARALAAIDALPALDHLHAGGQVCSTRPSISSSTSSLLKGGESLP